MESQYSESNIKQALLTLEDMSNAITQLMEWNEDITSTEDFTGTMHGMQLLAANSMLITALGEGINRVSRFLPNFLNANFPEIPWRSIVGMRNQICHGYFELDANVVYGAVKRDIYELQDSILRAINLLRNI